MKHMTTIERRAFSRLCTPAGGMLVVAADQRNGMRAVMNCPDGPECVSVAELAAAKADLVSHLGNYAPAILLDPEVALPRSPTTAPSRRTRRSSWGWTPPASRSPTACATPATSPG